MRVTSTGLHDYALLLLSDKHTINRRAAVVGLKTLIAYVSKVQRVTAMTTDRKLWKLIYTQIRCENHAFMMRAVLEWTKRKFVKDIHFQNVKNRVIQRRKKAPWFRVQNDTDRHFWQIEYSNSYQSIHPFPQIIITVIYGIGLRITRRSTETWSRAKYLVNTFVKDFYFVCSSFFFNVHFQITNWRAKKRKENKKLYYLAKFSNNNKFRRQTVR